LLIQSAEICLLIIEKKGIIMVGKKKTQQSKTKKLADPKEATIDPASQEMIQRAQDLGIETVFDRAVTMKPCNIGTQGICCKNCGMGPCRLPLPKGGIEGEDERKGICGATPNTIAARIFIRMIAGGAAAHSDHGRSVAEVFLSAARKETDVYKIKDTRNLMCPYKVISRYLPEIITNNEK
jgi:anaerobic carbon-monoxide dehydrogenase catalytic subunit